MEYYRATDVNPSWYDTFTEELENEIPVDEILDSIAELSCGIKVGASHQCQRYAKHVRTHIEAAYRLGKAHKP